VQSKSKRLATLKQLGAHLRDNCNIPVSDSELQKRTMPSRNDGPAVECWFGRVRLFDLDKAEAWARSQLRLTSTNPRNRAIGTGKWVDRRPASRAEDAA
jgi:hypothetical protein